MKVRNLDSLTYLAFLLIVSIFSYSCELIDTKNNNLRREFETDIVGSYKIDIVSSKLGDYNNFPKMWEATFTPDKEFYFSKQLPFFADSVGKWQYVLRNGVAYLELNFHRANVKQQALTDPDIIIIRYPQPKLGKEQVEEVILVKRE